MRPVLSLCVLGAIFWSASAPIPTGTVRGVLELPAEDQAVGEISVHYSPSPAPGDRKLAAATVTCPVRDRIWSCELPAGSALDLRLKAGSLVPVYLWGIEVEPGKVRNVGAIALRKGASVVGWVETEEGRMPEAASVRLSPEQEGQPDFIAMERLAALALSVRTNDRGFFQVEGVPAGRYELTVELDGYGPARISPIDVRPDLEAQVVERIVLGRPVTLDLAIQPPSDPYGNPWRIVLSAVPPASGKHDGIASPAGRWLRSGVAPGLYRLILAGDMGSRWHDEEIFVERGLGPLAVEVPVVEIEGRLSRGDEPLSGTLWFGGRSEPRRIRFDADEEGRFHGFLSEEGVWPVELMGEEVRVSLDPVEVRKPKGKRSAAVEIAVPDTLLAGEVVDEQGRPVPGAQVWAHHAEKLRRAEDNRVRTDDEGRFEIRGLPPGLISAQAEDGPRTSGWSQATVSEEAEGPPLRLVLKDGFELRGRVFSSSGPVAGARVLGLPEIGQAGISQSAEAVTDPAGEIRLSLPSGTRMLNLWVAAPGFARRMMKVAVAHEQPLEIGVEPVSGTLVLELPEDGAALLVHGGMFAPPQLLLQSGRPQKKAVLPAMEIGDYALCAGAGVVGALRNGQEPPQARCASGFLAPNSELVLKLPPSATMP